MKIKLINMFALTFGLIISTYASDKTMMINANTLQKASYIKMTNKSGSTYDFEQFLKNGAALVRQTEPNTPLWFALKENNQLAIFDVFFNEKGREQHFSGQVAHALKESAHELVQGGWEQGVLQNVSNYNLIASSDFDKNKVLTAKEASYITFKALPGKNQELEFLLKNGAQLINKTEPGTYFWVVLKTDTDTYAIFDTFLDKAAQKEHFSGQVATLLQNNAKQLVAGGWEKGILANVHNYQVIAVS